MSWDIFGGGDDAAAIPGSTMSNVDDGSGGAADEKVLRVQVHEACNIQDVQLFGTQDVYVELVTWPSESSRATSGIATSAGTRPVWDAGVGNDLRVTPRSEPQDTAVRLLLRSSGAFATARLVSQPLHRQHIRTHARTRF